MSDELIKRLKEAAQAATPQNLDTAQTVERYEDGSHITCPTCDGEGYAELNSDFCNYDGNAIGVQFYGIGPEHLAAEAYFRAASPAAILDLIALIEQQATALEAANARIAELEAAAKVEPVGEVVANDPVHGWHFQPYIGWQQLGAGRKLYTSSAALAQPLEAKADARDAERYRWLRERFTGYDFDWMPSEPDADDGKSVAVFNVGRDFRGGRDITAAIDAALANQKQAG